jgi:hypothetical protein
MALIGTGRFEGRASCSIHHTSRPRLQLGKRNFVLTLDFALAQERSGRARTYCKIIYSALKGSCQNLPTPSIIRSKSYTSQGSHRFFKHRFNLKVFQNTGFSFFYCFSCLMFTEIALSTVTFPQIVHRIIKKWKHSLQMWKMKHAKNILSLWH